MTESAVPQSPQAVTGLILSGGGARAAYQVGVLAAIAELLPEGAANPFVDPEEFQHYLAAARKDYDAELARQFAAKGGYVHP